ncbi:outer membrane cobalamin receptor protein BtuB [Solemya velum gill symbiont]|uniref:Outer membrane cobalamin receptor protein BtuB n=2 Tax=Solemya velum gill symbiont TaxID=2340 RepID=A0A0B0H9J3_SOVGS|nr:TonB-dependent receptor [Solemya velum gill symbiont]KHF24544.1 outer membrane cobalamin receptor protein BtuB [Solemya velum gill symbiont]
MRTPLLLAALLLPALAFATNNELLIVITATGNETPLNQSPGTTLVVTSEEMKKHGDTHVADALRRLPGITFATNGPAGQTTSLFARGTNSNHTLVMLDGMVLNDPSSPAGAFDFSTLSVDSIDSIEVVYGPVSTLYGSAAAGAVINMISKKPLQRSQRSFQLAAGSNEHLESGLSVSGRKNRFSYLLSLAHQQSDGETSVLQRAEYGNTGQAVEDDSFRNSRLTSKLGWQLSDTTAINLLAYSKHSMNEIDEWLFEDRDWRIESSEQGAQLNLSHRPQHAEWDASVSLRYLSTQRDSDNSRQLPTENFIKNSFDGTRKELETRLNYFAREEHILSLISNWTNTAMRSSGTSRYGSIYGDFVIDESTHADTNNLSLALQDQWQGKQGLSITGSLRSDWHDAFGQHTTWRLAANQSFADARGRLHFAAGTGFRAPTLNELYGFSPTNYGTAYRGNPALRPEESETLEAGIEYQFKQPAIKAGIRFYRTEFKNLIHTTYDLDHNSTSENISKANINGAEITLNWQADRRTSVNFNYSYADAIDNDSGETLLRRPLHQANLMIDFAQTDRLSHWLQVHYTGKRYDISPVTYNSTEMAAYTLVNIGSHYRWSDTLTLYGKVTNLGDISYEPVAGYKGAGISGIAGFNLQF